MSLIAASSSLLRGLDALLWCLVNLMLLGGDADGGDGGSMEEHQSSQLSSAAICP